jgi:hypothetical protein
VWPGRDYRSRATGVLRRGLDPDQEGQEGLEPMPFT